VTPVLKQPAERSGAGPECRPQRFWSWVPGGATFTRRASLQAGPIDAFLVGQAATPLSKQRDNMLIALVDSLQHFRPDLYSEQALRKRCLSGCCHVVVRLAFGAILASCTSSEVPTMGDAALVLFAIASWYLGTTIQLWRTHLLVKRINQLRIAADLVTQGSPAQRADGLPDS
jgi:hypothetical protein